MSSTTPRLGLKKWDSGDPFRRTEFNDNYDLIDQSPGAYICTSTSLPNWTSAQAGRSVWLTDQQRFQVFNGSAFIDPAASPLSYQGGLILNQNITGGSSSPAYYYTIGTWNVPRPGTVTASFVFRFGAVGNSSQQAVGWGIVNNTQTVDVNRADVRFNNNGATDMQIIQGIALHRSTVSAGTVTIRARVTATVPTIVQVSYISVLATLTT